ncbi:MAG: hypothetical protein Q7J35_01065 [Candidatus Methanoperedens sp.]|nr:hypothetical protein [Candidatus Methanoperedens sp.]
MTNIKNLFNLPPDVFDLVCEKSQDPEDPVMVYQALCQEIEIQVAGAYEHPEEYGRFMTIIQCALILENLRKDAAIRMRRICKECFEPLVADGDGTVSCNNPQCSLYFVNKPTGDGTS